METIFTVPICLSCLISSFFSRSLKLVTPSSEVFFVTMSDESALRDWFLRLQAASKPLGSAGDAIAEASLSKSTS